MDIKQIEAFCMVVKHGSFSRAAKTMGLSQPTVSAHISTLEKELGCELLIRTSRNIFPTEKGAVLLGYAQSILSLRNRALEELSRPEIRHSGSITIAASSVPAQYCLPELLSAFSERYPGVSYRLHNANSMQAVDLVRKGTADVALTGSKVENTNCEFRSFTKDELVLVTPNIPEAQVLSGMRIQTEADMEAAAKYIAQTYGCAVLLKGGHNINDANDLLYAGEKMRWFYGKRINNPNTHGTGCTLSSAIASNLACGMELEEAVRNARLKLCSLFGEVLKTGLNLLGIETPRHI